ncbi:hypothetical protein C5167_016498 [Papaver somniferum]|nr:hypothetical protein C5167_016498 [Papaver somniferum]
MNQMLSINLFLIAEWWFKDYLISFDLVEFHLLHYIFVGFILVLSIKSSVTLFCRFLLVQANQHSERAPASSIYN